MQKAIQIGYNEQFEKKCEFAQAGGFQFIAVNFTEMLNKTRKDWDFAIENIQRILDKTNLQCIQSHPYYYDLLLSSETEKEECEFAVLEAIRASGKLGASWCALHPRTSITSGYANSESLRDNKKYFTKYLEYAHKYNTGLAAENLPIFPGIIPMMPFYGYCYEDLLNLVDSLNDERVGICWDFGHAHMIKADQDTALKAIGKRLKCTHVHNNFGRFDSHSLPDHGSIQWDELMPVLTEIGYEGPLTAEVHCSYNDDDLLKSFMSHTYHCLSYLEKLA